MVHPRGPAVTTWPLSPKLASATNAPIRARKSPARERRRLPVQTSPSLAMAHSAAQPKFESSPAAQVAGSTKMPGGPHVRRQPCKPTARTAAQTPKSTDLAPTRRDLSPDGVPGRTRRP